MVDIIIVRTYQVVSDPRIFKIVKSLSKRYSVLVLGWNRENITRQTIDNSILNVELFQLKAPYVKRSLISYFYMTFYFALFWVWILVKLIINRPQVVHACDIDTIIPCLLYKILFRKKLLFDATVRYAMAFIPVKRKKLYSGVNLIEEILGSQSDVLVNGSPKELETFKRRPHSCVTIMNCPEDYSLQQRDSIYERFNNMTRVVYTGGIRRERSLESLASALKSLNDVELVMAGPIIDRKLFDQILSVPNVHYRGILDPREALLLEASSDIMIALYDLTVPWNKITVPNKVYEAMMCGIPIITNASSDLVSEEDCGIIIEYDNIDQISKSIARLRDDKELRMRLGNNGRKAFLKSYNWELVEERLFETYESLMK